MARPKGEVPFNINEYNKKTRKLFCFWLSKETDKETIEFLQSKDNRTEYLVNLIKQDILKSNS